jgi:Tfp pilus assembly protein PilE
MQAGKQHRVNAERGVSLSGLIFVLAIIAVLAVFAMKVFPTWAEYRAARDAIVRAKAAGGSVLEMKSVFSKYADINNISTVTVSDLAFSKESGETEISFAYEKRIPLAGNVSLLIDYAATTDKSGTTLATKSASADK